MITEWNSKPAFLSLLLLLKALVIKEEIQSWRITVLAIAWTSIPGTQLHPSWPLVEITNTETDQGLDLDALEKEFMWLSMMHKEGPCSDASIPPQKYIASLKFQHTSLPVLY